MRRPVIFVLLAGSAALVAALVVYSALKKREQMYKDAIAQSVDIVVAAHYLTIGSKLDQTSTKLTKWSKASVPPGALATCPSGSAASGICEPETEGETSGG